MMVLGGNFAPPLPHISSIFHRMDPCWQHPAATPYQYGTFIRST